MQYYLNANLGEPIIGSLKSIKYQPFDVTDSKIITFSKGCSDTYTAELLC